MHKQQPEPEKKTRPSQEFLRMEIDAAYEKEWQEIEKWMIQHLIHAADCVPAKKPYRWEY